MTNGEIYPNAPIAMVVAEVKHTWAPIQSAAEWQLIKAALSDIAPVMRTEDVLEVDVQSGMPRQARLTRFVTRDLHHSISFRSDAVVVETTLYPGWAKFLAMLGAALRARIDVSPVDGLERVGLRYFDEIRPIEESDVDWGDWVSPDLLGPVGLAREHDYVLNAQQGVVVFTTRDFDSFTVRFGAGEGEAVGSSPNLRRPEHKGGEFFLIDIDGAWAPTGGVPEFEVEYVIETLERLHTPISGIFESLITDQLREEVLRNAN